MATEEELRKQRLRNNQYGERARPNDFAALPVGLAAALGAAPVDFVRDTAIAALGGDNPTPWARTRYNMGIMGDAAGRMGNSLREYGDSATDIAQRARLGLLNALGTTPKASQPTASQPTAQTESLTDPVVTAAAQPDAAQGPRPAPVGANRNMNRGTPPSMPRGDSRNMNRGAPPSMPRVEPVERQQPLPAQPDVPREVGTAVPVGANRESRGITFGFGEGGRPTLAQTQQGLAALDRQRETNRLQRLIEAEQTGMSSQSTIGELVASRNRIGGLQRLLEGRRTDDIAREQLGVTREGQQLGLQGTMVQAGATENAARTNAAGSVTAAQLRAQADRESALIGAQARIADAELGAGATVQSAGINAVMRQGENYNQLQQGNFTATQLGMIEAELAAAQAEGREVSPEVMSLVTGQSPRAQVLPNLLGMPGAIFRNGQLEPVDPAMQRAIAPAFQIGGAR